MSPSSLCLLVYLGPHRIEGVSLCELNLKKTKNNNKGERGAAASRRQWACLTFSLFRPQRVHLDIQVGEHANDYAEIAAKDKLSELQLRVRQLVEQVEQIQKEQNYQRVSAWPASGKLVRQESQERFIMEAHIIYLCQSAGLKSPFVIEPQT